MIHVISLVFFVGMALPFAITIILSLLGIDYNVMPGDDWMILLRIVGGELYFFFMVWFCVSLLGMLFFTRFTRGHSLGYGGEGLFTAFLVKITAKSFPEDGTIVELVQYPLIGAMRDMWMKNRTLLTMRPRMLHSWLYEYELAINDICNWITSRVEVTKLPYGKE